MATGQLQVPRKLMPFVMKKKRYKVAFGGRGGAKSMTIANLLSMKVQTEEALVGCLREYQNSLEDSVFSLLKTRINALGLNNFNFKNNRIRHTNGGGFRFKGLARSIDAIKSMFGFKYFWLEEGQFISSDSLKILTPTLRETDSELWISANPMSEMDPFSQRFIVPYIDEINKNGFYEDDMHYIVKINYRDNPWFPESLEQERQLDFRLLPRALYDHVWEGAFNDSVENALVYAEWFDACVDAHVKLGFTPRGAIVVAHDPSDKGEDPKGIAVRHGSVILECANKFDGDINEGCDWATDYAVQYKADLFSWDCDGMGVGLNRQVTSALKGKKIAVSMFKGSETPDRPKALYESTSNTNDQKTNEDAFYNKRAQYYFTLRDRIVRTYKAVANHEYYDPEKMISFSSNITDLSTLRTELCRMPIKPNGSGCFELYSKPVMKAKFKFKSPNLSDSVMMSLRMPTVGLTSENAVMPPPLRTMGGALRIRHG